ncbi:MAG: hypothetical protein GY743_22025 [Planctomycetaceae bacterium]|nr:hypothetical protein [Planctomycetaceae bacterium]
MTKIKIGIFITLLLCSISNSSDACQGYVEMDLRNVLVADIVFIGRLVSNKEIATSKLGDRYYRREFEFRIGEILSGDALASSKVRFEHYTPFEPEKFDYDSTYVVVMSRADYQPRPQRAPSGVTIQNPEPYTFSVLSVHCGSEKPFIFRSDGEVGRAIRQIFDGEGNPQVEAEVLAKYLGLYGRRGF